MKQNVFQKNMWNTAGKAGLVLGLISTAYMFITKWTGQVELNAFLAMVLNGLLWILKFGGCIWIMMFFMKKFCLENPEADNISTRRLGSLTAFLSALVFAAFSFADVAFISTDFVTIFPIRLFSLKNKSTTHRNTLQASNALHVQLQLATILQAL